MRRDDIAVLWLNASELQALKNTPPPQGDVWLSATLGADTPEVVPVPWRKSVRVLYPYELPEQRAANLAYFRAWRVQRQLPLIDETLQSEVFFAFSFFTDTIAEMLDNLYRDYLIERAETMIDRRELSRAESEYLSSTSSHVRVAGVGAAGTKAPGPVAYQAIKDAGKGFMQRGGTTAYPHLTLGAGQRFASKGLYFVHYDAAGGVVAEGDWIVP